MVETAEARDSVDATVQSSNRSAVNDNKEETSVQAGPAPAAGLAGNANVEASTMGRLDSVSNDGTATVGPPPVRVVHPHNDDPWAAELRDELGVEGDARAFARLATARAFAPPLAVGIFGAWGSGKSFFMRLIHDHIERLKAGIPTVDAPEANPAVFHSDVVQIRFNAWHYAETNLWASLVDHIFTQLNGSLRDGAEVESPLDRLGTARELTLEAAQSLVARRREQQRAADALQKAKSDYLQAQQNMGHNPSVYLRAFEAVFNDPENAEVKRAKAELRDAAEQLGIQRLDEEVGRCAEAWESLTAESRRGRLILRGLLERLASGSALFWMCVLVFFGPPIAIYLMHYIAYLVPALGGFKEGVVSATVMMTTVTSVLSWAAVEVRKALNKLDKAKAAVDKAVDAKLLSFKEAEGKRHAELETASARVAEATALLEASTKRYVDASNEFFGSSAADRLVRFVRSRATDGHYAQHLGLIASIRKDFETLSEQLQEVEEGEPLIDPEGEAFEANIEALIEGNKGVLQEVEVQALQRLMQKPVQKQAPFRRIILFIDDLDRCPADKVVEVLQAVHMLLAFRLFVVFVAVDVRWIAQSLQEHYPELMASDFGPTMRRAGPSDYLEKIFQVPYWIPEVGAERGGQYLRSLFPNAVAAAPSEPLQATGKSVVPVTAESFELSDIELGYLEEFVPFVGGSPRKVLRLVNVYRLIKASGLLDEESADRQLAERVLVLQLTLATAGPDEFYNWLGIIETPDKGWGLKDIEDELTRRQNDNRFSDKRYLAALVKFGRGDYSSRALELCRKYSGVARRYSFAR